VQTALVRGWAVMLGGEEWRVHRTKVGLVLFLLQMGEMSRFVCESIVCENSAHF
jgi:hypothetical protein